jgi:hypothetical protein
MPASLGGSHPREGQQVLSDIANTGEKNLDLQQGRTPKFHLNRGEARIC